MKKLVEFLTALSIASFTACAGAPRFPQVKPKFIDVDNDACYLFKAPDDINGNFTFEREIDCNSLNNHFAVSPEDTVKIRRWANQTEKWVERNCQQN